MGCGPSSENGTAKKKGSEDPQAQAGNSQSARNPLDSTNRDHDDGAAERGDRTQVTGESQVPGSGSADGGSRNQATAAGGADDGTSDSKNRSSATTQEHSRGDNTAAAPAQEARQDASSPAAVAAAAAASGTQNNNSNSNAPDSRGQSTTPSATTVSSSQAPPPPPINPAVMLPTHVIQDATGRKVTSCIGSRTKLHIVTRWLDSAMKYRERLPDRVWPDPQDEAGRERNPNANSSSEHPGSGAVGNLASPSPALNGSISAGTPHHLGESLNPSVMNNSVSQMSMSTANTSVRANHVTPQQIPLSGAGGSANTPLSPGVGAPNTMMASSQSITISSINNPPGSSGHLPAILVPEHD